MAHSTYQHDTKIARANTAQWRAAGGVDTATETGQNLWKTQGKPKEKQSGQELGMVQGFTTPIQVLWGSRLATPANRRF